MTSGRAPSRGRSTRCSVGAQEEQLSLFSVISAVALGRPHEPEWLADDYDAGTAEEVDDADDLDDSLVIDLVPAAPAGRRIDPGAPSRCTRREHKAQLRDRERRPGARHRADVRA